MVQPSGSTLVADRGSSVTRVVEGRLYYRDHDACELAASRSLEDVASLIWTGAFDSDLFDTPLHVISGGAAVEALPFISRAQSVLPMVGARDPLASDLTPRGVARTGWRVLNLLTSVACDSPELSDSVEATLARAWSGDGGPRPAGRYTTAGIIRAALILSADPEPDASSFTARCIASSASNPYAVVLGGLAALEGERCGGMLSRIAALLEDLSRARDPKRLLAGRLRREGSIEGFGQLFHPDGDPRVALLLGMLPPSDDLSLARKVVVAAEDVAGEKPSLDFALVVLARALAFPAGSGLTLLSIGRTIGWIALAIEQYRENGAALPKVGHGQEPKRRKRKPGIRPRGAS